MIDIGVIQILAPVVLMFGLIWIAVVDARHFRIPDKLSFTLIFLGLANSTLSGAFWSAAIGAIVGYLVFVVIAKFFYQVSGRFGLGRGDAKLLAAGGAWCGLHSLPTIVLFASVLGLLFWLITSWDRDRQIPFGPFLSIGIAIAFWAQ